jgi:hypothetical protein
MERLGEDVHAQNEALLASFLPFVVALAWYGEPEVHVMLTLAQGVRGQDILRLGAHLGPQLFILRKILCRPLLIGVQGIHRYAPRILAKAVDKIEYSIRRRLR